MKDPVYQYYKQKFSGERSRFARGFDYIALRLLLLGIGYFYFLFKTHNRLASFFFSLLLVLLFSIGAKIVYNLRFERFKKRYTAELRLKILKDNLAVMKRSDFLTLCTQLASELYGVSCTVENGTIQCPDASIQALQSYAGHPCGAQELLHFYQEAQEKNAENLLILCTSGFDREAENLAEQINSCKITLYGTEKLLAYLREKDLLPHAEELRAALCREIEKQRMELSKVKTLAFTPVKAKRYLLCAGILFLGSFLVGFSVYYQIIAVVCLGLAGLSLLYPKIANRH